MAGSSDREKAANQQLRELRGTGEEIRSGKYDVNNRFNNYENPFEYGDVSKNLDDVFGGYEQKINRNVNEDISNQQSNALSRAASLGITGGSYLNDQLSDIANTTNKQKYNALGDLGIGKASSLAELMKYFNQNRMAQTQLGTNVDLANSRNKLGGLSNIFGLEQGAMEGLDDTTFWDDLFGLVKTGASSAGGIAELIKVL